MKITRFAIIVLIVLTTISCKDEKTDPARNFLMGFTPFPYDVTLPAVQETYSNITTNGDIINHHLDNGVPWIEALSGSDFSTNIQNDWLFRKNSTPPSAKLIISVAALNNDRNGMALYRGDQNDMELPAPWSGYSFADEEVKTAYLNYCKRVIDYFQPEYFNMNIEANLLHFQNPSLWTAFMEFHTYVYTQLKKTYPNLVIFSSITGAHLLDGYFDNNDVSLQRLAALQILEYSDLFGISFYPHMSKYLGNSYPSNSFDELFSISDKPVAIAETGYPAQDFELTVNTLNVPVQADQSKQRKFLDDMLKACAKHDALFVIYFAVRDYDQLWTALGSKHDISIAWRDTGLLDENGNPRMAMDLWTEYHDRPLGSVSVK